MIDIKFLGSGDPCPCGNGEIRAVDVGLDYFVCRNPTTRAYTAHDPMPGGGYTNLTNVSVTPPRVTYLPVTGTVVYNLTPGYRSPSEMDMESSSYVPPRIDFRKYPHRCRTCGGACYIGYTALEHAATGTARCP